MGKMRIDSCPRCGKGDISLDKDHYGWYEYCLQCGYMKDLVKVSSELRDGVGHLREGWHGSRLSGRG